MIEIMNGLDQNGDQIPESAQSNATSPLNNSSIKQNKGMFHVSCFDVSSNAGFEYWAFE